MSSGLTGDGDGGAGLDQAAVGPHAVAPRSGGLHFEAYSFVGRVPQLQVRGHHICEGPCTHPDQRRALVCDEADIIQQHQNPSVRTRTHHTNTTTTPRQD